MGIGLFDCFCYSPVMPDFKEESLALHTPNYYLLKKHVSYTTLNGYSQTIVNVMVNQNKNENQGKFLFVKNYKGFWTFSRRTLKDDTHKDIFEGFIELIGDELGYRGLMSNSVEAMFYPIAYLFDVAKQDFDDIRIKSELSKGRNPKGKVYHLLIIHFLGDDNLPFENRKDQSKIVNYKWVSFNEAMSLLQSNFDLRGKDISKGTAKFHLDFFHQINELYNETLATKDIQKRLF